MRYPAAEKLEIIRLVEQSRLPVRRTLDGGKKTQEIIQLARLEPSSQHTVQEPNSEDLQETVALLST